ncbi:pilus assembly protein CpaD [uncultured Gammaproteobacteria bacterium]
MFRRNHPKMHRMFSSRASLLALVVLLGGGCADSERGYSAGILPTHPIQVKLVPANLTVGQTGTDGRFTPKDRERVAEFLDRYRDGGRGAMNVTIVDFDRVHAERTLATLQEVARRHGVNEDALNVKFGAVGAPVVTLSWVDSVAVAPVCQLEVGSPGSYDNTVEPMFGCAFRHSLAAMVANPADLSGNRSLDASDSIRLARAVDNYRQGKKMPAESDQTITAAPSLGSNAK